MDFRVSGKGGKEVAKIGQALGESMFSLPR